MPDFTIRIPTLFSKEIKYTIEILLEEFLGLTIQFELQAKSDFEILSVTTDPIIIKSSFFHLFQEPLGYLQKTSLPSNVTTWTDADLRLQGLPVLYGQPRWVKNETGFYIEADLIASSYFMLARWEEIIDTDKDHHQRSTARHSLAWKHHFLQRPIVNEYADLIWYFLLLAGFKGTRKKRTFQKIVTHDLDQALLWPDLATSIRHLGGDLLKRRNLQLAISHAKSFYSSYFLGQTDPFDTYQKQLELADKYGIRVYFNILVSRESKEDSALKLSDPRLKEIIHTIETAGHAIGFHPGYNTYHNQEKFNSELDQLQNLVKQKIKTGRQHFLRFEVSTTWKIWDQAGMQWDSTMGYSDQPGFRCGTCYTYTVFDCQQRKKLAVQEKPMILMDATLVYYIKKWNWDSLFALKNECIKHQGEWVTLWHNDLLNHPDLSPLEELNYQ
jgi:hypothetical protein